MKSTIAIGVAAAAWLTASWAWAAPLETYAQLPLVSEVAISGDGAMIAIAVQDAGKSSVLIRTVGSEGEPVLVNIGPLRISGLRWEDAEHLAIFTELRFIMEGVSSYDLPDRHEFDLKTKKLGGQQPGRVVKRKLWDLDDDHEPLFRPRYIQATASWSLTSRGKIVAHGSNPYGPPVLLAKGSAPDSYLMLEPAAAGEVVREFNLKSGEWAPGAESAIGRRYLVNSDGEVFGVRIQVGDEETYEFKNPSDKAILDTLKRSFPNERVTPVSWSDDHKKVVLRLAGVRSSPGYVLVDLDTKKASFITDEYKGLAKGDVAEIKPITYKAADGLEIHGYLTLPNGRPAQGLPLVVLVHDGPQQRDVLDYSWWVQALASRGYAVLQSNFRGSTGYGEAFAKAGIGEFGRKMQSDLSDGVRDLARQGIVDLKRVCIAGEGYGGYAALAGAAFDRGVYRCAVAVEPISDLTDAFTPPSRGQRTSTARYWANLIGVDNMKDRALADWSPVRHADQVEGATLVMYSKNSLTVGYDQGRRMADALEKARKAVETVHIEDRDKGMTETDARLPMLQAMVTFLEKNNPPN